MTRRQLWIIAAAGLVFALIFGVRQSVALFIGPINSATGLGVAAISLAFACAQLMWGITQPIAGAALIHMPIKEAPKLRPAFAT